MVCTYMYVSIYGREGYLINDLQCTYIFVDDWVDAASHMTFDLLRVDSDHHQTRLWITFSSLFNVFLVGRPFVIRSLRTGRRKSRRSKGVLSGETRVHRDLAKAVNALLSDDRGQVTPDRDWCRQQNSHYWAMHWARD